MLVIEQLAKCLAQVGAVSKSKENTIQRYKFRGIDDFLNAVQPVFAENKIICLPNVLTASHEERETKNGGVLNYVYLTVQFTFYAVDGSNISATTAGEAMDSSDKATNKAMSAALKYCLINTLCIGTEEAKDSEDDDHELKVRTAATPPKKYANTNTGAVPVATIVEKREPLGSNGEVTPTDLKVFFFEMESAHKQNRAAVCRIAASKYKGFSPLACTYDQLEDLRQHVKAVADGTAPAPEVKEDL
jgi:hypothetical protein